MTRRTSESRDGTRRRDVLKASGVAVGVGALGSLASQSAVADRDTTAVGERLFVEVDVTHRDAPDFPLAHTDDFAEYLLDRDAGSLTLTPFAGDAAVEAFRRNDLVVRGDGYAGTPTTAVESRATDLVRVGDDTHLQIESEYAPPAVRVRRDAGDAVTAAAADSSATVEPSSVSRLELPAREVAVRRQSEEFETTVDPRTGDEVRRRKNGPVETATVTPVVTVRNHGWLDVAAMDGGEN